MGRLGCYKQCLRLSYRTQVAVGGEREVVFCGGDSARLTDPSSRRRLPTGGVARGTRRDASCPSQRQTFRLLRQPAAARRSRSPEDRNPSHQTHFSAGGNEGNPHKRISILHARARGHAHLNLSRDLLSEVDRHLVKSLEEGGELSGSRTSG